MTSWFDDASDDASLSRGQTTALVTGSVALGAYLTGAAVRRLRRARQQPPASLPPALDAEVHTQELMEGQARYYARPGEGPPIVLLHSFNAAASSFEMKPIFEHLAAASARPLYALDWFGFGLSDRPPIHYRPDLYRRQLRRFLSEKVAGPADLVALSLGAEYAAVTAAEAPFLVRRLALVMPTSVQPEARGSAAQRAALTLAYSSGAFELFFYRLTRPASLRQFYARQVFREGTPVPEALVAYAHQMTQAQGAHHAPRRFIDGTLFLGAPARRAYASGPHPTLVVAPEDAGGLVQDFDGLADLAGPHLTVRRLPTGLLPQWEASPDLFELLDDFLLRDAD